MRLFNNIATKSSVVICLGQLLNPNGSLPFTLMDRVSTTAKLVINNQTCVNNHSGLDFYDDIIKPSCIIFTGSEVQKCGKSEAQAMWEQFQNLVKCTDVSNTGDIFSTYSQNAVKYFKTSNVTVVLEEKAKNTLENFLFSREIVDKIVSDNTLPAPSAIYVVTNDFHSPRALLLAKQFFKEYSCAATPATTSFSKGSGTDFNATKIMESFKWEKRALSKLNQQLSMYKLPSISNGDIIASTEQLDILEKRLFSKTGA